MTAEQFRNRYLKNIAPIEIDLSMINFFESRVSELEEAYNKLKKKYDDITNNSAKTLVGYNLYYTEENLRLNKELLSRLK